MKNVKIEQLKKCIFLEQREFDDVLIKVFGDNTVADYSDSVLLVFQKETEGKIIGNGELNERLAEYFDVKEVTSVHLDFGYDNIGVWISYKD